MSPRDLRVKIKLEATVSPSEDPGKVADALRNVVREHLEVALGNEGAVLATSDMKLISNVRDQLRDRHIRSAARRQLLLNSRGRTTFMMLNRQGAVASVVAVCASADESPLGPIYAAIESDNLTAVIDWLTAYGEG